MTKTNRIRIRIHLHTFLWENEKEASVSEPKCSILSDLPSYQAPGYNTTTLKKIIPHKIIATCLTIEPREWST